MKIPYSAFNLSTSLTSLQSNFNKRSPDDPLKLKKRIQILKSQQRTSFAENMMNYSSNLPSENYQSQLLQFEQPQYLLQKTNSSFLFQGQNIYGSLQRHQESHQCSCQASSLQQFINQRDHFLSDKQIQFNSMPESSELNLIFNIRANKRIKFSLIDQELDRLRDDFCNLNAQAFIPYMLLRPILHRQHDYQEVPQFQFQQYSGYQKSHPNIILQNHFSSEESKGSLLPLQTKQNSSQSGNVCDGQFSSIQEVFSPSLNSSQSAISDSKSSQTSLISDEIIVTLSDFTLDSPLKYYQAWQSASWQDEDLPMIEKLLFERIKKKNSNKTLQRSDVYMKTLFRVVREYYKKKLDQLIGDKKKHRLNKQKQHHLEIVDTLVHSLFGQISEDPANNQQFSHYLAALINDRFIQEQNDQKIIKENRKLEEDFDAAGRYTKQEWERLKERTTRTITLVSQSQNVLYKFNKASFQKLLNVPEYLKLIVFVVRKVELALQSDSFKAKIEEITVKPVMSGENQQANTKRMSLKRRKIDETSVQYIALDVSEMISKFQDSIQEIAHFVQKAHLQL